MASLMQEAGKRAGFKRPDVRQFTPPNARDTVDRVVAAGLKIMTAPAMREDVQKALDSKDPMPKKLAENVTGLLLTLDQQSQGGIPMEAIFPAAMELLGEAAEVAQAAGQTVTQEDYNDAARTMFVLIAQKLGGTPEQIMGAAEQAVGEQAPEQAPEQEPELPSAEAPPDMPAEEMA